MSLRLRTTLQGEAREFRLEQFPARLGRASGNAVQLLDGTVSKEHAEIAQDGARYTIRDLGSRNGTRVNGRDATQPQPLAPGDRLEVGHLFFEVLPPDDDLFKTRFATNEMVGSALSIKASSVLERPTAAGIDSAKLLHLIAEAGQLLVLPRPLGETCETLLGFVEKALPASRLVILLRDVASGELVQVAARHRGTRAGEPLALSQTIMRLVLGENTSVLTGDATQDPRFLGQHSIIAQAIHSAMAVPLFDNQTVLGILYADSTDPRTIFAQGELELFTLLGNMAAVKITNSRLLEAEQTRLRLEQEVATAMRIQRTLLPAPPKVPGWQCHARLESCYEVGGDLYDFHTRPDGELVVLLGDVSGKGMGAALLMSSTLSSARVLYDSCAGPLDLIQRLNAVLHRSTDGRSFVTMFVGWLDVASGRMRYVNAGHPEPHLVKGGVGRTLEATGIPVGMLPDFPWVESEATIAPGELFAVFSDGIPEAQHGQAFFEDERVSEAMRAAEAARDLPSASDVVIDRIDAFADGDPRADDVTLVLLRREPAGA